MVNTEDHKREPKGPSSSGVRRRRAAVGKTRRSLRSGVVNETETNSRKDENVPRREIKANATAERLTSVNDTRLDPRVGPASTRVWS